MRKHGNIPAAKTLGLGVIAPSKSCIWCGHVDIDYDSITEDTRVACSRGKFKEEAASCGAIRQLSIQICGEFMPSRSGLQAFGYPKATLDDV